MIARTLLPFILLILLPDLYIYGAFVQKATKRRLLRMAYWLPSLALCTLMAGIFAGQHQHDSMFKYLFMSMLCLMVPKLLFALVSVMGKAIGRAVPPAARLFNYLGLALSITALSIFIYGFSEGWKRFTVRETTFTSPDLPASFDGYRILQFSDLHIGTFQGEANILPQIIQLINNQHADAIVFTGDLVNSYASELDGFDKELSQLHAHDGVFAVLGNHDYGTHGHFASDEARDMNLQTLKAREKGLGWTLLLNENRVIHRGADSIAILGVENDGRPPFPELGNLDKAQQGVSEQTYKVLLSHDPTHWRRKVLPQTSIQLTLSGHTHGMQFQLGSFSPSKWVYKEWSGLYLEGKRGLHVSIGLGEVMFPFRFGAWPEVNIITLRKQ